ALLILFEVAFQLGLRLNAHAHAGYEREVFLAAVSGFVLFGIYLSFFWAPFLDSTERMAAGATTLLGRGIYALWDGYVWLLTIGAPAEPRRIEVIQQRYGGAFWWVIPLAFFAIPAAVCFVRLIRVAMRCANRAREAYLARVVPVGPAWFVAVRPRLCRVAS